MVDPDAEKTWEQICEGIWRELSPAQQAEYQQHMKATGQTWVQVCERARAEYHRRMQEVANDPTGPFARFLRFRQFPYGQDPRLTR